MIPKPSKASLAAAAKAARAAVVVLIANGRLIEAKALLDKVGRYEKGIKDGN